MASPLDTLFRLNCFHAPRTFVPRPHDVKSFLDAEGLAGRHLAGRVIKNKKR
jgi:hypothetical protein